MLKGYKIVSLLFIVSIILKTIDVFKNLYIASIFGVSDYADIFSSVIILPDYLIIFLGLDTLRGVVNSEYSTWINENKFDVLLESYTGITSLMIFILPVIIIIIIIFSSQIISLILPGFTGKKKILAESIFIITSPLFLLKAFIGYYNSILNSFKIFIIPLFASGIVSVTVICMIFFNFPFTDILYNIAVSTLAGNIILFIVLFIHSNFTLLNKVNLNYDYKKIIRNIFHFKLNVPTKLLINKCYSLFFVVLANVLFLGSKNYLASFFGDGAISSINYASTIPTTITTLIFSSFFAYFLNSIASLKNHEIERKRTIFIKTFNNLLYIIIFIISFLIVNSFEILTLLFQRGQFSINGVLMTQKPFIWEVLSMLSFPMFIVPTAYLIAEKKYSILNKIGTVIYLFGIFICYFLSKIFSFPAISAGIFITQFIYGLILLILVYKEIIGNYHFLTETFKILFIGILTLIISYFIREYFIDYILITDLSIIYQLIIYSLFFHIIIYLILSYISGIDYLKIIVNGIKYKNEF